MKNFRNYDFLNLDFDPNTNIFYGDNAQGKTNILESIYLTATTKSHRGAKDKELIKIGREESHIEAVIEKKGVPFKIDIHLKKNSSKGIAVNKMPLKKASELFGIINIVIFSPEDLNIIKNGPAERRRFIDLELSQLDRVYLNDLSNYNKIVNQRNRLLRDLYDRKDLIETLDVWDMQLITYGKKVMENRKSFLLQLNEIIGEVHEKLTGGKESLQLFYEPSVKEEDLKEVIFKNRERDIQTKNTSAGPHRDDILFMCKDMNLRKFGSQGQQRTAALSLKMAEIELIRKKTGDTPVLLLDDVLSELDKYRQNDLIDSIHDVQTLITCTGVDEFIKKRFLINKIFQVANGNVK